MLCVWRCSFDASAYLLSGYSCSLPFSAFSFSHQLFDLSLYNNLLHATYYIVLFPLFHCNWRSRHFHDRLRLSFLSLFQIFTFFTFLYLHLLSFPSVSRSDAFSFAVIIYTFCAALVCLTFVSRFCYVSRFRQQNYLIFSNGFPFRLSAYIIEAFGISIAL